MSPRVETILIDLFLTAEEAEPGAVQKLITSASTKRGAARVMDRVRQGVEDVDRADIDDLVAWLRDVVLPAVREARQAAATRPVVRDEPKAEVVALRRRPVFRHAP